MKLRVRPKKVRQTRQTFHKKWQNYPDLARESTINTDSKIFRWIMTRNGFQTLEAFETWLNGKYRILDAGCGNGRIISLFLNHAENAKHIIGIDINIDVAQAKFLSEDKVEIFERDISKTINNIGKFDFIYCQEVLHHTKNPRKSFKNLISLLMPEGEIAIYVYKKKAPAREFMDEYIRHFCDTLTEYEKNDLMEQITIFGKNLQEQKIVIESTGIPALGIPEGQFPLQAFIYDYFFKCFWNSELNLEDNIAINEDWYYPKIASKHTLEEVRKWFNEFNIKIVHQYEDANGITIRGIKS